MADINKTVSIDYKADLSRLISELEKLPDITGTQAKKMVQNLNRQLKQSERSIVKNQKAMARSLKGTDRAAREAERSLKKLKQESLDAGDGIGDFEAVLRVFNPKLAEASGIAGDVTMAIKGARDVFGSFNPIVFAAGLAIAATAAAVMHFKEENEQNAEALKTARKELEKFDNATEGFAAAAENAINRLQILRGETTQYQSDLANVQKQVFAGGKEGLTLQGEQIKLMEKDIKLVEKSIENVRSLSSEEKTRLAILSEARGLSKEVSDLGEKTGMAEVLTNEKRKVALKELTGQLDEIKSAYSESVKALRTQAKAEEDILHLKERNRQREEATKKANKARAEAEKRAAKAAAELEKIKNAQMAIDEKTEMMAINRLDAEEKIKALTEKGINDLKKKNEEMGGVLKTAKLEAAIRLKGAEALSELEQNRIKENLEGEKQAQNEALQAVLDRLNSEVLKRKELQDLKNEYAENDGEIAKQIHDQVLQQIEERNQKILSGVQEAARASSQAVSTFAQMAQETRMAKIQELQKELDENAENLSRGEKRRIREQQEVELEALNKTWKIKQAAQISSIIMSTAGAIMKAYEDLGPLGGALATAGLTALGAAQIAVVANEQPPALHTGGMVRATDPSEVRATLRSGEGVLTAQGVQAAGGSEGLRSLNQGGSNSGPMVVQLRMGHRVIEESVYQNARRGGAMARAISKTGPMGRVKIFG